MIYNFRNLKNPLKKKTIHLGIDWEDFSLIAYDKGLIENYKIFSEEFITETNYLLDFLKKESIKCTFFCNGRTAEIYPYLVNKIDQNGHQIAAHAYNHTHRDKLTDIEFLTDCIKAKTILEKIICKEVLGYRSPYLSFNSKNLIPSLKILSKAGYLFDSSITYASLKNVVKSNKFEIGKIQTDISIKPLFSINIFGKGFNLAGGSIWRLVPSNLIFLLIKYTKQKQALNFYLHPYEFGKTLNPRRAIGIKASKLKLFLCFLRWNLGRKKIENLIFRLNKLNEVKFSIYE